MLRVVEPELLDDLPVTEPGAIASRADLRRLNGIMGHTDFFASVLRHRILDGQLPPAPVRLMELGAGDGTLLLRILRKRPFGGATGLATLVDRQDLMSVETRSALAGMDWSVESETSDVFQYLEGREQVVDVIFANLFLHHFDGDFLRRLLGLVARRARVFLACEPRRAALALTAARTLGIIGCSAVTRHDAVISVRAGFCGRELSALWPKDVEWHLSEYPVGWFSHGFLAQRHV